MIIGIPKEIKNNEYRVGLIPSSVKELVKLGHQVFVEKNAGVGIGFSDEHYKKVGAEILDTADEVFANSKLIVKVKEPQIEECKKLTEEHILFTFLHLAPDLKQAEALVESGCVAIAYETVEDSFGRLPLLSPMSEVAGRLAVQIGASYLEKPKGGKGVLLGGVPGVSSANVLILGGGVVGTNSLKIALGMGANVTVVDKNIDRLKYLDDVFGRQKLKTIYATSSAIESQLELADLIIGAVLVPGAAAPRLITREHLSVIQDYSVLVDVAIDQGGCFETSRPTTVSDPVYLEQNIVHYCVTNMPGGVPKTSAIALNNVTLPYVIDLANKGFNELILENKFFRKGVNVYQGHITCEPVAEGLGMRYRDLKQILTRH